MFVTQLPNQCWPGKWSGMCISQLSRQQQHSALASPWQPVNLQQWTWPEWEVKIKKTRGVIRASTQKHAEILEDTIGCTWGWWWRWWWCSQQADFESLANAVTGGSHPIHVIQYLNFDIKAQPDWLQHVGCNIPHQELSRLSEQRYSTWKKKLVCWSKLVALDQ